MNSYVEYPNKYVNTIMEIFDDYIEQLNIKYYNISEETLSFLTHENIKLIEQMKKDGGEFYRKLNR